MSEGWPATGVDEGAAQIAAALNSVVDALDQVIVGHRAQLELVLCTVLAGGHLLIEDVPGTGKTLLARALGRVLGLDVARVQCTPDLLPSDITGSVVLDPTSGAVAFRPGPVFTNVLLVDELNRTSPKTQSALLEAMAESQVTADKVTRPLPAPFVVLATQNPIEYEGTYTLPEAQLDRFTTRLRLGYLDADQEVAVVSGRGLAGDLAGVKALADADAVLTWQRYVSGVEAHPDVVRYAVDLCRGTRTHAQVLVGASVRGAIALLSVGKAMAAIRGRDFVVPADVSAVAVAAIAHRLTVRPELWLRPEGAQEVVADVLAATPEPAPRPRRPQGTPSRSVDGT